MAYFLTAIGHPLTAWEPEDAPGYEVEFAVSPGAAGDAFVEVKSLGWESELTEGERLGGRLKLPKHLDLEGRAADLIGVIRRVVEKARPKFSGKCPSLLVVSDDCFVNLGEWGWGPVQMALLHKSIAYGGGLFHRPNYANIGAACLFWLDALRGNGGID